MKLRQLISFLITLAFRFGQKIKNFQINPNLKIKLGTKPGFSLVELSIVVLIIGGMTGSLVGANNMVKRSRLVKAKSETASSPVKNMDGLALWYEAVMEESIDTANNATNISIWHDLGPNKINATQATSGNQPKYIDSAINKLPAIRFDGIDDLMTFVGGKIANNNYTIIIVEQRRTGTGANYFLSGTGSATPNSYLYLGYSDTSHIVHGQTNNSYLVNTASYGLFSSPKIHVFTHNSNSGKKYYQNTGPLGSGSETTPTALVSYVGASIGGTSSNFYNGDIGEIIIFNRTLSDAEQDNIENYLAKKWYIGTQPGSVPVNTNSCTVTTAGVSQTTVNNAGGTLSCTGANFNPGSVTYTCSGSPTGTFASSPTNCPCITHYTLSGSVCQPDCQINVTGYGSNGTYITYGASGSLTCNGPNYTNFPYSCTGSTLTGHCDCNTSGYYWNGSSCAAISCPVSVIGYSGASSVGYAIVGSTLTCSSPNYTTFSYNCTTNGVQVGGSGFHCNCNTSYSWNGSSCAAITCPVSVAGYSGPSPVGYTNSGSLSCNGPNYTGTFSYSCTNGAMIGGSGFHCNCSNGYSWNGSSCASITCPVSVTGSSTSSVIYGTASVSCNQTGYTGSYSFSSCTGSAISGSCTNCASGYTYAGGTCGQQCYISGVTGIAPGYVNHNPGGGLLNCNASGYSGTINYTCNNTSWSTSGTCSTITCPVSVTGYSGASPVGYTASGSLTCNSPNYTTFPYSCTTGATITGNCNCASGYGWNGSSCVRLYCSSSSYFDVLVNPSGLGYGIARIYLPSTLYQGEVIDFDYLVEGSTDCAYKRIQITCPSGSTNGSTAPSYWISPVDSDGTGTNISGGSCYNNLFDGTGNEYVDTWSDNTCGFLFRLKNSGFNSSSYTDTPGDCSLTKSSTIPNFSYYPGYP